LFAIETDSLDVSNCYSMRNYGNIGAHSEKRFDFVASLNKYDWKGDPQGLKRIK